MSPSNHTGRIITQDTGARDIIDEVITAQPISPAEIEDVLYDDSRPAAERLARLRQLRADLATRQAADFGDDDPGTFIDEIDDAIARLDAVDGIGEEAGALDIDPLAHRETLSPDSDELEALEDDDEASLSEDPLEADEFSEDEVLDPKEWDDQDGFDPDRGVR